MKSCCDCLATLWDRVKGPNEWPPLWDKSGEEEFKAEKFSTFQKVRVQIPGKLGQDLSLLGSCSPQIETIGLFFGPLKAPSYVYNIHQTHVHIYMHTYIYKNICMKTPCVCTWAASYGNRNAIYKYIHKIICNIHIFILYWCSHFPKRNIHS